MTTHSNYMQVGQMTECTHCHPEKHYGALQPCECICHTTPTHQNEAEWDWEKEFDAQWQGTGAQTMRIFWDIKDFIRQHFISKAQIAEVVDVDGLAERIVIDYANRSGRDDNRPEVRDAARAVLEAVREKLLGNEGKGGMNHNNQQMLKNNMRRENDREAQLLLIREKCIAANPRVGNYDVCPCGMSECQNFRYGRNDAPIRLADVLLAMKPSALTNVHIETNGNLCVRKSGKDNFSVMAMYNLRKDDLTLQSDDTIKLLADLLA